MGYVSFREGTHDFGVRYIYESLASESLRGFDCERPHEFFGLRLFLTFHGFLDPGVSKNRGTPKWMVHNGKPY